MRILHTADWHVGRSLRGRSRADEHRAILEEIVDVARRARVDLVLVAGDQFDSSSPNAESEAIVWKTLLELADTGAQVVVIAGNHDHPNRLAAVGPLLEQGGRIHVRSSLTHASAEPLVLSTRSGEKARIALLPFLPQRHVVRAAQAMELSPDQNRQSYAEHCRALTEAATRTFEPDAVNLIVAHWMFDGARVGGGERSAHTVVDYSVPIDALPAGADYAALGHVHRTQRLLARCAAWYCGSPLQLDFGDKQPEKLVLLVEIEPGRDPKVTPTSLSSGRTLRTLSGTLAELEAERETVGDELLRILVEEAPRPGLGQELRELFPNAVDIRIALPSGNGADPEIELRVLDRAPRELFAEYLTEQGVESPELTQLFADLLEEAQLAPD